MIRKSIQLISQRFSVRPAYTSCKRTFSEFQNPSRLGRRKNGKKSPTLYTGEKLFKAISQINPVHASKITGIFLRLEESELEEILHSKEKLEEKVKLVTPMIEAQSECTTIDNDAFFDSTLYISTLDEAKLNSLNAYSEMLEIKLNHDLKKLSFSGRYGTLFDVREKAIKLVQDPVKLWFNKGCPITEANADYLFDEACNDSLVLLPFQSQMTTGLEASGCLDRGVSIYVGDTVTEIQLRFSGDILSMREELHELAIENQALIRIKDNRILIRADLNDMKRIYASLVRQVLSEKGQTKLSLLIPETIKTVAKEKLEILRRCLETESTGASFKVHELEGKLKVDILAKQDQLNSMLKAIDQQILLAENQSPESCRRKREDRRARFSNFDLSEYGIGGLHSEFSNILRRTFQSRMISPILRKELGLNHIKGIMMHGPPGCGKTMLARVIARILDAPNVNYINAPEIESKYVGESEKNIRAVFQDAIAEYTSRGEESGLHVIIFDEIDAITRARGGHNAKARDGALHQLLCELDGLNAINNILVFGLTNRIEDIDSALLRPGRFEAHIEIPLPDANGRREILDIHCKALRASKRIEEEVDLQMLADATEGMNGADMASIVRIATASAIERMIRE